MHLTTGQARTRVLGMTFRPGPSPLGGPRPRNSKKDGGERGTASGEDFGTNQGEGNHARVRRPSRQLYNGTEEDSRGSHFGAVTSGQSLRDSRPTASLPCYKCSPLTLFDTAPVTAAVGSPPLATSPQCECYGSLLYPSLPPPPPVIRPADHALPVLKFRSKPKLQVRVEDGIYHLVPSIQAGTRDQQ